ncbi:centriolar and ciliogenesis-associated protein HYLS1 [Melanerpes formicivorus]|uniref:centriolar and ciliogenesis-associated protein HYLS1 n=1 Tax=Melanerpes formicivorus TaxID=211600 RepID=UPI00358E2F9B
MEELTGLQGLGQVPPEDEEQLAARLALYAQQEDSEEWTQPSEDPYSEASLSLEVQPALPEEQRGTRRLVMKRKVLRHRPDGRVEVTDESEYNPKVWRLREGMLQPRAEDSISEGQPASLSPGSTSEGQPASLSPGSTSEGQPASLSPGSISEGQPASLSPGSISEGQPASLSPGSISEGQPASLSPGSISEGQPASLSPGSISEGQPASLSPGSISEGQPASLSPGSISEGQPASLSPGSISEGQPASLSPGSISEGQMETSSSSFPHESAGDSPLFILRDLPSRSSRASQCSTVPKSFMPPRLEPLGQPRVKTDCVAKYLEYKREWERLGIPGEAPREELRRAVREQMRCPPALPAKPRRPLAPSSYTAPGEKPRAALRWEVRWHLANGLLPCSAARRPSNAHSC